MAESDQPRLMFFGDQAERSPRPVWSQPARPPDERPSLAPGTGCVIIIPPGHRRPWSAVWAAHETAEHAEWFDAETFRDVAVWASSKAPIIYLRESAGELTRLSPPIVEPS